MRWNLSAVASCAIVCAGVFGAPGGINSAPITIGDNSNASPYPSQIVIGSPLTITNISVGLRGLSHARLSDLSVLLVSPTGKKIMLLANAPGSASAPIDLFLAPEGQLILAEPLSGEKLYRPTVIPAPVAMPAPAPGLPYETSFASLIGEDAAGTWSLYVRDNVAGVAGQIASGWSITLNAPSGALVSSEFGYQGVLKQNGAALNGTFDIRMRLFRSPLFVGTPAGTATAFAIPVENGVFSTSFTVPDSVIEAGQQLWAEIAVKGAGDADFVTIEPRQMLMSAPFATYANVAARANVADTIVSVDWSQVQNAPWAAQASSAISNTNSGNVLIGTTTGTSKLTVNGTIESLSGGVKFPDDSVQTTAATTSVIGSRSVLTTLGAIAADSQLSVGVSFTGTSFQTTDVVVVSPSEALPSGVGILYARASSAFQAQFVVRNFSASPVNIPQMTWTVKVIR